MKKIKFTGSLKFKSWSYFVLFALSVLLLLQLFQLLLFEPFYRRVMKNEIKTLTQKVAKIYFDEDYQQKDQSIKSLTMNSEACILILNRDTQHTTGYNSLGDNQCVIYADSTVNQEVVSRLDNSGEGNILIAGNMSELSSQESMIYGEKYQTENEGTIYILANMTLQNMKNTIKTIQGQLLIIIGIVLILSIVIAFWFSDILSTPITQITAEARKLLSGNYDLNFEKNDIDELQQLADTVDLAAKEISKVEEFRKELMSNVSHDIKTPLTMIKAYAEMIKDISGENREKREEHLDIIINETDRLSTLVSDMLDLSKLQAGSISVQIEPFDLSTLVINCVEQYEPVAAKEGVHFKLECETELMAYGDKGRINEVLVNFISNALKHYGKDKEITVRAKATDREHIRVEIVDNGSGIDEKYLPYIWDRYFKIDKKYKRAENGSGLGLAINKAILELHEAHYGVISESGKGSTFYFVLKAVGVDSYD